MQDARQGPPKGRVQEAGVPWGTRHGPPFACQIFGPWRWSPVGRWCLLLRVRFFFLLGVLSSPLRGEGCDL